MWARSFVVGFVDPRERESCTRAALPGSVFSRFNPMGIQGLTKLIADNAPQAIKENAINNYFGRKIAVDASMTLYQFLIAVRPDDTNSFTLTNESGETTRYGIILFAFSSKPFAGVGRSRLAAFSSAAKPDEFETFGRRCTLFL